MIVQPLLNSFLELKIIALVDSSLIYRRKDVVSFLSCIYCGHILLANCSKSGKSGCLLWLLFVTGIRKNLSSLPSKFIWHSVNCLFERFFDGFLFHLQLRYVVPTAWVLTSLLAHSVWYLFPFSPCLRLGTPDNKPVSVLFISCQYSLSPLSCFMGTENH